MTLEWLVSPEVAYLDISHPLLQVLGGRILEGEWALQYPANNGLSAPWQLLGKESRPLRISWETDNGTGVEVSTVITARVKESRGVRVLGQGH